jgi:hypothetical protein
MLLYFDCKEFVWEGWFGTGVVYLHVILRYDIGYYIIFDWKLLGSFW